jgi:hypothetical protein
MIIELFQAVMKLYKDAQACNIIADIMAIIDILKPSPTATAEEIETNGELLKALLAIITQVMSNPILLQIILKLLSGGLLNKK